MTLEDIDATCCTIDISHDRMQKAEIKSLAPFHVHLRVGHPRLCQLSKRIAAANSVGDYAKARQWQGDHDRLVRALAGQAALMLGPKLKRKRRWFDWSLTVLFTASTLLYATPKTCGYGVIADILLLLALYTVEDEYQRRLRYIGEIIASSFGVNKSQNVALQLKRSKKGSENAKH